MRTSLKFSRSHGEQTSIRNRGSVSAGSALSGSTDYAGTLAPTRMPAKRNPQRS
jgi:hypothetical protein